MVVTIDLGVIELDLEDLSVHTLDLELEEVMRAKSREAFLAAAAEAERLAMVGRTCPVCGMAMNVHDRRSTPVQTLAGEVRLIRRRLRCPACGAERYPLEDFAPRDVRHTLAVIERALFLATELSYAKASEMMKRFFDADISHGQLQRLAKKEGALVGLDLSRATADLFELGLDPGELVTRTDADTLVMAIDGGAIPDRGSGDDMEAKVGVIYGVRAEVSKGRIRLLDRVGYASLEDSYVFMRKLSCLALMHGCRSAGRVLAIGDGATWIRRRIRDFFPRAVYLLDLFHLKRRIRELLGADERDGPLCEEVIAACVAGRPDEAQRLLAAYRPPVELTERWMRLIAYIRANREGISNYARSDLLGSGAVEKAVDILVSRRFKCRGMSWLRPGASGMLGLRLLRFNREWDSHWAGRLAACHA